MQDTIGTNKSASYLYIHLEIYIDTRLRTKLYNKTDDFNCELSIYVQQHSSSTCIWSMYLSVDTLLQSVGSYQDFLDIGLLLITKLLNQRFLFVNLKSSLRKFYDRICNQINTVDITSGGGTAYPSRAPKFTPEFQRSSRYSICSFMCMFCTHFFVLLFFFFWPLCCLFFFDICIWITLLVSSNSYQLILSVSPLVVQFSMTLILFCISVF